MKSSGAEGAYCDGQCFTAGLRIFPVRTAAAKFLEGPKSLPWTRAQEIRLTILGSGRDRCGVKPQPRIPDNDRRSTRLFFFILTALSV